MSDLIPMRLTYLILMTCCVCVDASAAEEIDFSHEIVPILKKHCVECHGGREAKGSFSLNTRELLADSGYIDLEVPADSYLLELMASDDPEVQMPPPKKRRVSKEEMALVQKWIASGMKWEAGFTFGDQAYEPPLQLAEVKLPPAQDGRAHPIDRLLDQYFADNGLKRPSSIDDATFLRRVSLDLNGLLPDPEVTSQALKGTLDRQQVIGDLLDNQIAYADHWLSFFNDLLRNDYSGTGFITGGRKQVSKWLYASLMENKRFDQMARELIAPPSAESQGFMDGIKWRGNVSAGQTLPIQFAQSVGQAFLGINLKCASCHDSFIARWTLDDSYGLAAIYAEEPLEIHRCDKPIGRTAQAGWLFPETGDIDPKADRTTRLNRLAELMTDQQNGRFARTIVNRLWARLMGHGLVHPLDAMQTPPWNAEVLEFLAVDFVEHGYDLKHTLELIATSEAYQSQAIVIEGEVSSPYVFRGPHAKRMTAEQFLDGVWSLTESAPEKMDAPVFRADIDEEAVKEIQLQGKWIWGESARQTPPAGEQLVFRKTIKLDAPPEGGVLVVTCDNEFQLFINRREATSGKNWNTLQSVSLRNRLKKGDNEIVVIGRNAGAGPNAAGLYCELRYPEVESFAQTGTDESWEYSDKVPTTREGRLGGLGKDWKPVVIVPALDVWANAIHQQAKTQLATGAASAQPMIRASLMKNNSLMRSMGRPMREQIVSARPTTYTTLEAVDLATDEQLAQAFAAGGRNLASRFPDSEELAKHVFLLALGRLPDEDEMKLVIEMLGPQPSATAVEDLLWTLCMLPDFMLIR